MTAFYWTEERIIAAIRGFHAKHNRTPKAHEWDRSGIDHPERETVRNRFGSWNNGIVAAGFAPRKAHAPGWTPDEIVDAFLDFLGREGRWPTSTDLGLWRPGRGSRRDPFLPQWQTVRHHFGSLKAAKLAAGWDPDAKTRVIPEAVSGCVGCGCELDVYTTGCRTCVLRRQGRRRRLDPVYRRDESLRRADRLRRAKRGLGAVESALPLTPVLDDGGVSPGHPVSATREAAKAAGGTQ